MSHHIHNILLFRVKFGLEVEGLGFPGSQYALFLTMLLYVIHFSSPVIIRFKKGSILFRASRDVHMTTRSSKFFWLNSCGTHLEYFHTNPIFRIWSEMVCWAELSLSAISDVVGKGSCSNIALTTSSSIKDGRPERGLSERSKSPVSNFSYHLLHVLSETVPSPNTFNKFLHASVAFLPCWNSYKIQWRKWTLSVAMGILSFHT